MRKGSQDILDNSLCKASSYIGRKTYLLFLKSVVSSNKFSMKYIKSKFLDNFLACYEEKVFVNVVLILEITNKLRLKTNENRVVSALENFMQEMTRRNNQEKEEVRLKFEEAQAKMEDSDLSFNCNFYVQQQEPKIQESENRILAFEKENRHEEKKKIKLKANNSTKQRRAMGTMDQAKASPYTQSV